jgi:succinyl-diaminopimelate desuccinylase
VPGALAQRTLELVDIPSESRNEQEIAAYVAARMPWRPTWQDGETLWYDPSLGERPLVILAGHLDTVPAQDNIPGRIENGAVHGLGASDMKAGVAVMIELARWMAERRSPLPYDPAFVFFPREELPVEESPLPAFFRAVPRSGDAALAIVLEPTDAKLHAGCMGNLNANLVFRGRSAHSARPWLGDNAIERAVEGLRAFAGLAPEDVVVDGLVFREVVTLTGIEGGLARNVVPDRVVARVNHRFAPGRSVDEAVERVRSLAGGAEVEVLDASPAADVARGPLVERLRRVGGLDVEPKQAWTPVAEFSQERIPAVNYGPGATRYAHTRDEQVEIEALETVFETLKRFLSS